MAWPWAIMFEKCDEVRNVDYGWLNGRLGTLTIFRRLLMDETVQAARRLFAALETQAPEAAELYCAFVQSIWARGGDLSTLLCEAVLMDDNFLVRSRAAGKDCAIDPVWIENELDILATLAGVQAEALVAAMGATLPLPSYRTGSADIRTAFLAHLETAQKRGYGIFAKHPMLYVDAAGALAPVLHPDPQTLNSLRGYAAERQRIVDNTRALLSGQACNNVLLYGDAGTGKSSTVKGLANAYFPEGLRLVQLERERLSALPGILDVLAENPLKFILFIDDLSFRANDPGFMALKAALEGGVRARPSNVAIYATSNRRHLVQESFQSRIGDELHLNDTLEESASLAARFGLVVNFARPERELYLDIVRGYAALYGLSLSGERLAEQAEAFAIRAGGRTPRAAKQFVEQLLTKV